MGKSALWVMGLALAALAAAPAAGQEQPGLSEEIGALKDRVERLEQSAGQGPEAGDAGESAAEGGRPWYEAIDIAVGATGILQGTPGVKTPFGPAEKKINGSMSFDLELNMQVTEAGKAYALFEASGGEGIDGHVPTFSGFNDDAAGDDALRPTELWYEHSFGGGKARLRGGLVDLTTDFDTNAVANSETDQFLSTGFVNNLGVEFPDDNGFGAMLWLAPNDQFDIGVGFADADADWDEVFKNPFTIVELGYKPKIAGRQGGYRVYGWHNSKDHERLDVAKFADANYGFGFSADQEVADGVTLFARYGHQRASVSAVEHAWSAGLQVAGRFGNRADDVLGVAYGQAVTGKAWKDWILGEEGVDAGLRAPSGGLLQRQGEQAPEHLARLAVGEKPAGGQGERRRLGVRRPRATQSAVTREPPVRPILGKHPPPRRRGRFQSRPRPACAARPRRSGRATLMIRDPLLSF